MSERDPQRWSRFALSVLALLALGVAAPIGLIAAARSRFGSANPLSGADPPWRWGSDQVGDAITGPIADDTVIDGIIRLSLCVVWVALAVIVVTTLAEVVHAVRHHGLGLPDIRGVGWAQRVARFIAVGLVAVLPLMTSSTSLASTLDARAVAAASTDPPIPSPFGASVGTRNAPTVAPSRAESTSTPSTNAAIGRIHVVAPGESIYSIAVDLAAGDSSRVLDIADELIDANVGAVMPGGQRFTNPAYIEAGWQLQIPTDIADPRADDDGSGPVAVAATYTVEDGDTLWDIADEQLGDPAAWPEIWERNAGDDMGGGRTFDDPDLILPGWELELDDVEPATAPTPSPAPVSTTGPDDSEDEPSTTPAEGTARNVHLMTSNPRRCCHGRHRSAHRHRRRRAAPPHPDDRCHVNRTATPRRLRTPARPRPARRLARPPAVPVRRIRAPMRHRRAHHRRSVSNMQRWWQPVCSPWWGSVVANACVPRCRGIAFRHLATR